jgi:DNA-binding NtrC family response regulator
MIETRYLVLTVGERLSKNVEIIKLLQNSGYEVKAASSATNLEKTLSKKEVSIVLVDPKDPVFSGYEAMRLVQEHSPETQIIVVSQKHSTKEALETQSRGAYCYFTHPVDVEEFLFLVAKALIIFELATHNRDLKTAIGATAEVNIVGNSKEERKILAQVERIAAVDTTVLLNGESGTGKTTLARFIHTKGNRSQQPFVSVSCATIPRELLEAELFGYERGAFTGATSRKLGSIELADKGTLFLDEIGDLPLELQPKLLTFLQDRQLRRLGSTKTTKLDVRIIVATNRNLQKLVETKDFREDLYFRINVVSIVLPSLRERRDDIEALSENFLQQLAKRRGEKKYTISKAAVEHMQEYSWPGNIRELENVLERASLFCTNQRIDVSDLGISQQTQHQYPIACGEGTMTLAEIERLAIEKRLEIFQGNKQKTAHSLGISLKTIYNKMRTFGLA